MKTKNAPIGFIIIVLLAGCMGLPSLGSSDPDVVATAAASMLAAVSKTSTFGATPDTVYYGSGCSPIQPTKLILYFYKPETWIPEPSTASGTILNLDFNSSYSFENDARTEGSPQPESLTYSSEMTSEGYRYSILDLTSKTFSGEPGWLHIILTLQILRASSGGLMGAPSSFGTWIETQNLSEIYVRAKPCPKVPIFMYYTGSTPTVDRRFSGSIDVTPDLVHTGSCTPNTITVRFKPDYGPSLATREPITYWTIFTYKPKSLTSSLVDNYYPMFWTGGPDDGAWQVIAPIKDWSVITEDGTVTVRVEVHSGSDPTSSMLYSAQYSHSVLLKICTALVLTCPGTQYSVEKSLLGTPLYFTFPTMSGGCGDYTLDCTPISGTSFPRGSTSVVCNGADSCGNSATCSFIVQINEAPPVTLTCPADITRYTTSSGGLPVTFDSPSAGGGCDNPTVVCTPSSGSTFPIGSTLVTCTASDTCLHTNTCSFKVNIIKELLVPTATYTLQAPPPPTGCGQYQDQPSCSAHQQCTWNINLNKCE
jgi:hypothetical protein